MRRAGAATLAAAAGGLLPRQIDGRERYAASGPGCDPAPPQIRKGRAFGDHHSVLFQRALAQHGSQERRP